MLGASLKPVRRARLRQSRRQEECEGEGAHGESGRCVNKRVGERARPLHDQPDRNAIREQHTDRQTRRQPKRDEERAPRPSCHIDDAQDVAVALKSGYRTGSAGWSQRGSNNVEQSAQNQKQSYRRSTRFGGCKSPFSPPVDCFSSPRAAHAGLRDCATYRELFRTTWKKERVQCLGQCQFGVHWPFE